MNLLPLFLLIIFSLFVFYSISVMIKRGHDFHALAFFILFIYTIFAQIGYAYFPELSTLVGAYFGQKLFYKYWSFMFLSFFFTFLLYKKINPKKRKQDTYAVKLTTRNYGQYFFFSIVILLYISLSLYFIIYKGVFGYGGGSPMGGPWFGIGFLLFQTCTLILYIIFRDRVNKSKKRIFSFILFIICIEFFLRVVIASGTRSPIAYLFIAIVFYELFPLFRSIKYQKRKIFFIVLAGFFVISILSTLRALRTQGEDTSFSSIYNFDKTDLNESDDDLSAIILLQDYYLPSHTLFVSMNYNIIDPVEVIKSNFANSLVTLKYPFLTTTILNRAYGTESERGVGWAYHYFVEGYNALGFFGIFYNALFWNLGMLLWIKLTQSNNERHNKAMLAISVLVIISVMKSQTSAFIQFYWLILLPGLVLLLLINNSTIAFFKRT